MYQDGLVIIKQRCCFFYTASCFKQFLCFVRDANIHTKVIIIMQITNNLISKVVYVHHNAGGSRSFQTSNYALYQRLSAYCNHGFGHGISQRFEACAHARCKNHCLHAIYFFF